LVATLTTISVPQVTLGQPRRPPDTAIVTIPQFVATAINFKALDETGWDWTGSDEVEAVFADFNKDSERWTPAYEDVDSGETKNFSAADQCIAPQPDCSRGTTNFDFGIALWERDKPSWPFSGSDFCYGTVGGIYFYNKGVCSGDDLIGRVEVTHSQADLVAALPTVGQTADFTVRPSGGDGSYTVTYRITRLPNVRRLVAIGPGRGETPPPPIALQASLDPTPDGTRVNLTWTGATATNVDVYFNGMIATTTPNDGQYLTGIVPRGTYKYRLCNAGSVTFCSADVSITVT
jgi:hypothetical protein